MITKKLKADLFDKIPQECNVVIFGACEVGKKILNDLKTFKPNVKVIGFIDNRVKDSFENLPIWNIKEFIDKEINYHTVIMSTKTDDNYIINIFDIYDIPVIEQTGFVSDYYRNKSEILSAENYKNVLDIYETNEDKKLFETIFKVRKNMTNIKEIENYHFYVRENRYHTDHACRSQYLEKINKNKIKVVLDLGLNDGFNVIAFKRFLPNLENIYGFEVIYDIAKKEYVEEFILDSKLEIVPFALGDSHKKIKFFVNKGCLGSSFSAELTTKEEPDNSEIWTNKIVDVITLDSFCKDRNVEPDFIKMDIEGAELSALKGGIQTIQKHRPQLAISIYHSNEDFIKIPLYLKNNLKGYKYFIGHYSPRLIETILYAIPKELV